MSVSGSTSQSSLAPTTTEDSHRYPAQYPKNHGSRPSLTIFTRDLPSLIHRTPSQKKVFMNLFTSQENVPHRPSTKSENRLYNFLSRSRSRSRSKPKSIVADRSASVDNALLPDLPPLKLNGHARYSSLGQLEPGAISSPLPGTKPPSRIQSRPLSSTTTATNTTITPPTPTQTRRPKKYPPDLSPFGVQDNPLPSSSRPSTPKSITTRQKLQNLFGIQPSSRRASSVSRPSSPGPSQDIPPLPHPFTVHNLTRPPSNPNASSLPDLIAQGSSPPGSQGMSTKGKARASIPTKLDFFRNQRRFSSSQKPKDNNTPSCAPAASQVSESFFTHPISVGTYSTASSVTSASDQDHNVNFEHPPPLPPLPVQIATSTAQVSHPRPVIPSITHTPPTPQKRLTSSPPQFISRRESTDSKRAGWRPLTMVGEEDTIDRENEKEREREREGERGRVLEREAKERRRWSSRLPSPKLWSGRDSKAQERGKSREERERPTGRVVIAVTQRLDRQREKPRPGTANGSGVGSVTRNGSKHGSFDFEKPIWGKGGGSGGSAARSGYSRSGDSLHTGASESGEKIKATSAKTQKNVSTNLTRHHSGRAPATVSLQNSGASSSSHAPSLSTALSGSGSPPEPGPGGSSSLGRATRKRAPQLTGVGISHGPFAFEPAVPSPTMTESSGLVVDDLKKPGREHKRDRHREKERVRGKELGHEKEREKIHGDSGYRVAGKGRSLDLGLGLSWAPTRVREDALMASFGQNASSAKKFRSKGRELGKSQVASDVTEVFRDVLNDDGFAAFKKYVHLFDAHSIPFDGPSGIINRVEKLLDSAPRLDAEAKRDLLDRFIRILLQHA